MKKVLIAEDDPGSQFLLAKVVEGMGYVAIKSSNGRLALEILQDNPEIDLVITDIMMPEMGGRDLIQELRQDAELENLPIMLISAIVSQQEIEDLLELGASLFIQKPINMEFLRQGINELL
ncbi:MAG: response regulator [SAR324 cluster bacterium]|nr:response regulator [SAR324 cluster bacterium]